MVDHVWALDHIATYLADGLETAERLEFEGHIQSCPTCAQALAEAREFDTDLGDLFSGVRPRPGLEDRMIRRLRERPQRKPVFSTPRRRFALAAAAVLVLGFLGAGLAELIEESGSSGNANGPMRHLFWHEKRSGSVAFAIGSGGAPDRDQYKNMKGVSSDLETLSPDELARNTREQANAILELRSEPKVVFYDDTSSSVQYDKKTGIRIDENAVPTSESGTTRTKEPTAGLAGKGEPTNPRLPTAPPPPPASPLKVPTETAYAFPSYFKPNPAGETTVSTLPPPEAPAPDPVKAPDPKPAAEKKPDEAPEPAAPQQKIIRSGDIEFEVEGFDTSVEKITKIAVEEKGFVGTINSDKLPNGKMRGTIVVRVPPDRLDTLILKLRALGDLKGQRIGSQDVTKQYTDVESRLRAARAMEGRLLDIIKSGKGEIKDLLAAEKELGTWRTKIEEMEGEIRYFNNLVSLSTLTITLTEREIRSPFGISETERIELGIEVEDVDKSHREAQLAITDAKGRITKSELKQQSPGQYQAVIEFDVAPGAAGALRDRLRQLGEVTRLDIGRSQSKEGGSGVPLDNVKVKQQDVHFSVSLYNITNVAPRETVVLDLACVDAEASYREMLTRVQKVAGRILTNKLDRQRNDQTIGTIQFEVKTADADGVLADLKGAGEVIHLTLTENPDTQNSTRSKRGFQVQFLALGRVGARETAIIQLATRDVPATYQALLDAVAQAKGRIINANLDEQVKQNVSGFLEFEVRRTEEGGINTALKTAGDVISRRVDRALDSATVIDSKIHMQVALKNQATIAPRETYKLGLEVSDVDQTVAALAVLVKQNKGRVVDSRLGHERNGQVTSTQIFDVPLSAAPALVEKFKASGVVFSRDWSGNSEVPDGDLALARIIVVVTNASPIVAKDQGFFASIRQGLSWSLTALSYSLMFVIVGLLAVLPWAVVIYAGYRVVVRFSKKHDAAPPVVPTPAS
jgi:hypothetical protein